MTSLSLLAGRTEHSTIFSMSLLNLLKTGDPKTGPGSLVNSEDQDEMQHNAAFYQGMHCLLRHNQSSEKEIQYFKGNYNLSDPSIYTLDHPDLIVSNFMGNSIGTKKC